jgi:hypothetical protein
MQQLVYSTAGWFGSRTPCACMHACVHGCMHDDESGEGLTLCRLFFPSLSSVSAWTQTTHSHWVCQRQHTLSCVCVCMHAYACMHACAWVCVLSMMRVGGIDTVSFVLPSLSSVWLVARQDRLVMTHSASTRTIDDDGDVPLLLGGPLTG